MPLLHACVSERPNRTNSTAISKDHCPGLSYIDGLEELNLSTLVDRGELLCKRFHENNFGSSSNISGLLAKKNFHSYNFRNARNIPLF